MTGRIARETLRGYIHNYPLTQTIQLKMEIDDTRKKICNAEDTLRAIEASASMIEEIEKKREEYTKISQAYGNMIESVWGIVWQNEAIIKKYIDLTDAEIDMLPDYIELK